MWSAWYKSKTDYLKQKLGKNHKKWYGTYPLIPSYKYTC